MTPAAPPPAPGSMTVPPLFGWEVLLTGAALVVLLAVAGLVVLAAGRNRSGRAEWQAWLESRSAGHREEQPLHRPGA
ncbi:hypothetical protein [Geodermatophilus sp. SYSU D00815]